jgi:hypothetical protein
MGVFAMSASYPAQYADAHGEEQTTIENDGKQLRMVLRDVEFRGSMFDDFEPVIKQTDPRLASFALDHGLLTNHHLECEMPLPVVIDGDITTGRLQVYLRLGEPLPGEEQWSKKEILRLGLTLGSVHYWSRGTSGGWFEDELLDIQKALPEGAYLKACIMCALSDYSPVGSGMFGCLACFRGNKDAYRQVSGKYGLFAIWPTMTEFVQETYLCPEFERRQPGAGYRG